jgi:sulfur carrier protein ThiS
VNITLKMYASLAKYLPPDAERNVVAIEIADGASVHEVIDRFHVPREAAHLVLVNGVYVPPEDRDGPAFTEGDVLAVWPPVAGG